ncbi:proteasome inhibitor PI31 subunit [Orussus abietinus]|uniref:proteasome inhibitor PI31 subunit n=1 Tax=Orussus abietinus TaxID=222816 RepID=UPI0006252B63|nr:proteasome inhibitor PI31 subunit [Orussus abietinus]
MADESNSVFGFELLNKLVENQLQKKEDIIILFVHWYFVKNGFKCIGTGDSKTFEPSEQGSESLPDEWNQRPNYALRYVKEGKLYILLGTKSDADLLLNLLRVEDHSVSNVQFPIGTTVSEIKGPLTTLMPDYQNVLNVIRKDLVEPVYTDTARETSTQTPQPNVNTEREIPRQVPGPDFDPLRVGQPHRPAPNIPTRNPEADPFDYGRSDLDPFNIRRPGVDPLAPGGGMIFNPFQQNQRNRFRPGEPGGLGVPGRLPPGAVPPGARFDPFGPPDIERRQPPPNPYNPDNDHMPPPGYDDMFM